MSKVVSLEDLASKLGLTDAIIERLRIFDGVFMETARHHNLVSRTTLPDRWERHYLDSAQLYSLLPQGKSTLLDIGSGAGFPGLILGAMGAEEFLGRSLEITLVESTGKKATFLKDVGMAMGLTLFHVKQCRIETLVLGKKPDIITARALAPLVKLCDYIYPLMGPNTQCLFMKGAKGEEELATARQQWQMNVQQHPSKTSDEAVIYQISKLAPLKK